jgi:hypothetical protein
MKHTNENLDNIRTVARTNEKELSQLKESCRKEIDEIRNQAKQDNESLKGSFERQLLELERKFKESEAENSALRADQIIASASRPPSISAPVKRALKTPAPKVDTKKQSTSRAANKLSQRSSTRAGNKGVKKAETPAPATASTTSSDTSFDDEAAIRGIASNGSNGSQEPMDVSFDSEKNL